jgi:hypothetical protein
MTRPTVTYEVLCQEYYAAFHRIEWPDDGPVVLVFDGPDAAELAERIADLGSS